MFFFLDIQNIVYSMKKWSLMKNVFLFFCIYFIYVVIVLYIFVIFI